MMRFSVIVPAYNVAGYVERTLDSLLDSLTEAFELIIVNDGSTDGTPDAIAAALAKTRGPSGPTVVRADIPNAGVSVARNEGLRRATGEYVTFVDGDDYVTPDYAQRLLSYTETDKPDIAFFRMLGRRISAASPDAEAQFPVHMTGEEALDRAHRAHTLHLKFTLCAYRRDFLLREGIIFTPGCARSQDSEFLYKALVCAERVTAYPDALYAYVKRPGSAVNAYRPTWPDGVDATLRAAVFADARGVSPRTAKTLSILCVYAFIMLRARAIRLSPLSTRALLRQIEHDYPAQTREVTAQARAHLSPCSKERLAMLLYRACPGVLFLLTRMLYREIAV